MIDRVKVALDVHIDDPFRRCPFAFDVLQCCMWGSSWSRTMRTVFKDRLIDLFQDGSYHFLHEFVVPGRDAKSSFLSILFCNIDSSNRMESITSVFKSFDDI